MSTKLGILILRNKNEIMWCPLGAQETILSSVMMVFSDKIGMN